MQGQPIAQIAQTDIEQRHTSAVEVFHEREREHADLTAKVERELASKSQNFAKLEAAFNQVIKATDQRIEYLTIRCQELWRICWPRDTPRDATSRIAVANSPMRSSARKTPRTKS